MFSVKETHREVDAAQSGQEPGQRDAVVAHPGHADARGVDRLGHLACRPKAETEGRAEEREEGNGDEEVHQVDQHALGEEGRADDGDVAEERYRQLLEAFDPRRGSAGAEDLDHQKARAAKGEQVDGGA
jgi:hypothetical protein